ncbi:hypothetical protein CDA63_06280 [Hymenobacter amundsenii]|uniref:Uncharacterized protein n=1 Tax=Hymenobacter amundsenii TaxID=2006685 RepID=A0A246FMT2_9BACT|nr:hypothetical protein [Hymenobacter amundsenii]OWP64067.1 hypothetical protein CDA63_06280 [Hymenobacter amundsenii]
MPWCLGGFLCYYLSHLFFFPQFISTTLLQHILDCGTRKTDRIGTSTLPVFSYQMWFNLQ